MRKFLIVLLSVLLLLASSCSNKTAKDPAAEKQPSNNGTSAVKPSPNNTEMSQTPIPLDKLPQKYTSEQAVKNGDIVQLHSNPVNVSKLENFIDSIKAKKKDMVRIVNYTTEGDAVIYELTTENGIIKLILDASRDKFSAPESRKRTTYAVTAIAMEQQEQGEFYVAKLSNGGSLNLLLTNNQPKK